MDMFDEVQQDVTANYLVGIWLQFKQEQEYVSSLSVYFLQPQIPSAF